MKSAATNDEAASGYHTLPCRFRAMKGHDGLFRHGQANDSAAIRLAASDPRGSTVGFLMVSEVGSDTISRDSKEQ